MSYDIIMGLNTNDGQVNIKSASNNVSPRTYRWWVCDSLTKILHERGQKAYDIEVLKQYENGNFHTGTPNRYSKAIDRLHRMEEYKLFDWRVPLDEDYRKAKLLRSTPEFDALLYRAFQTKEKKQPCIIKNNAYDPPIYVLKVYRRKIPQTMNKDLAKRFDHPAKAQGVIDTLSFPDNFSVELLA